MAALEEEILCYEYYELIKDICELQGTASCVFYGLDNRRKEIHDKICELMKINKSDTTKITDNIDKYENGGDVYIALLDIKNANAQST